MDITTDIKTQKKDTPQPLQYRIVHSISPHKSLLYGTKKIPHFYFLRMKANSLYQVVTKPTSFQSFPTFSNFYKLTIVKTSIGPGA